MTEEYWVYTFQSKPSQQEVLIAFLSQMRFESFEQKESEIDAYITEAEHKKLTTEYLKASIPFALQYSTKKLENKNWNQEWESNFEPVHIDDFCFVYASFHKRPTGIKHYIQIDPKMAFGTGHHETTYMMLDRMQTLDFNALKILDFGTGTGVLAILAKKLGAAYIDATDNDVNAIENATENQEANQITGISFSQKTLSELESSYDIILANINRRVLLDSCKDLRSMLSESGILIISGIMKQDFDLIHKTYESHGFNLTDKKEKGNWLCLTYTGK